MGKKTIELYEVTKKYGDQMLLKDFTYTVTSQSVAWESLDRTDAENLLLKIMAGLEQPDEGRVEVGETIKIGYLAQEELPIKDSNQRVIDYVKEIGEYVQTRDGRISASQMLERFLFTPDMQYTPISKLSGGEKRRLYLLSVLVSGANVLILDERQMMWISRRLRFWKII